MPLILVVDDSVTDRALIKELLKHESMDWIVEFAESAEQAMVQTDTLAADVIVTDMMMPGMNGLQLLERLHSQGSCVPVILMSGQSGDELAVEAVRKGASSYVPKDQLATKLSETIKQVLGATKPEGSHDKLVETIDEMQFRFTLDNDPQLIPHLIKLLQQMANDVRLFNDENRTRFGVALDEALVTAMCLGNLELPLEALAETRALLRDGKTCEVLQERRSSEPYSARRLHVHATVLPSQAEVVISSDGGNFCQFLSEDAEGHRSLNLISSMADTVSMNDQGTEIRLVKFRDQPQPTDLLASE